jgi:membrane-associated phospholipid phosphatase
LLFAHKPERDGFWTIAMMGAEAAMFSYGVVGITKASVLRPRPFLYQGSAAPLEEQLKPDARFSFFSGHTAFPATALFFGASVFSGYHPDSKLKPLVWTLAAVGPMMTGFLRIKAGKHFPTDVATGYVLGAGIGLLVPWLHRSKDRPRSWNLAPTGNGITFNLSF